MSLKRMIRQSGFNHICQIATKAVHLTLATCSFIAATFIVTTMANADNWPTYHHDYQRSGVTTEQLPTDLKESWTYRAPAAPRAAWDEPATWDGYNKVFDLKNRQVFDKALHPIVVDDRVYFGSSVDDQVYCLDLETGNKLWRFYTEGPVRLAPTWHDGRIYVGSDDGHVYCLNADDGTEVWRTLISKKRLRVPGNGRLISMWPVRTGVIVSDGVAYACAGVFPSETIYLSAMNANTGAEIWQSTMSDFPAQGYLLASSTRLYVTTGRNKPLVFDIANGKRLYQVKGGAGGTYALLTGDTLVYGPGKDGNLATFEPGVKDQLATFGGNHMVVRGGTAFLHTDAELTRMERSRYLEIAKEQKRLLGKRAAISAAAKKAKTTATAEIKKQLAAIDEQLVPIRKDLAKCLTWRNECDCPFSLVVAGDALVTGGANTVAMFTDSDGSERWRAKIDGNAYGLAVAKQRLLVSTDKGVIYCFSKSNAKSEQ